MSLSKINSIWSAIGRRCGNAVSPYSVADVSVVVHACHPILVVLAWWEFQFAFSVGMTWIYWHLWPVIYICLNVIPRERWKCSIHLQKLTTISSNARLWNHGRWDCGQAFWCHRSNLVWWDKSSCWRSTVPFSTVQPNGIRLSGLSNSESGGIMYSVPWASLKCSWHRQISSVSLYCFCVDGAGVWLPHGEY